MSDLLPSVDKRLDLLVGDLERARHYGTGLILFVIYRSESVRADLEQQLLYRMTVIDQKVRRIRFGPEDKTETHELLRQLRAKPPAEDETVFIYQLRFAFPVLIDSLNYRREYIPDHKWRLLFWAREREVSRIMRDAPDFWAFVNQTIELLEILLVEQAHVAGELAWEGLGDEIGQRRLAPDEWQSRIAQCERLRSDLADNNSTHSAHADLKCAPGGSYYFEGQPTAAEPHFHSVLDTAEQTGDVILQARVLTGLGLVYHSLARYEDAVCAFQKAMGLDAGFAYPWAGLGYVYWALGLSLEVTHAFEAAKAHFQKAIAAFQKAIELDPQLAYAWKGLGYVYTHQGNENAAIASYLEAIEIDPKDASPWNGLGIVYFQYKDDDDDDNRAIGALKRAIELDPKYATPWNYLGNVYYYRQARHQDAIDAFINSTNLDPKCTSAWRNLGKIYQALGHYKESKEAYQHVIELDPHDANVLLNLGVVYQRLGQATETAEYLNRVRGLLTAEDYRSRARLEAIAGNVDASLEYLMRALDDLNYGDWVWHDPYLTSLRGDPRFRQLVTRKARGASNTSRV